ncbi:MAG: HK97 gp10 family phage protein [Acidaminococcus sp.]|uniref:HK97 gp10 family phage protein n=1 Tax=Acidaminococcus sp. TaxID=1872103 RepID=UPI0026DF9597|nr:HK97 gp10 family phage protein [Acidaminococcus sp.]MDO5597276.1 HK97 gp10 family phage protein [Acidaminococcus sp.]
MGIHFSNFDKFSGKLETITEQGLDVVDRFLDQEAETIKGRVQDNTPVDTGLLRERWFHTPASGGKCQIYNNVDYAAHVEYGHRTRNGGFVKGRKMLHRGMLQSGKAFEADCAAIYKKLLGG